MAKRRLASGLVVAALVLLASAGAPAAELPTFQLAELGSAELIGQWSDGKTDGDVKYRQATKGKLQLARVNAWWPEGSLRPPEKTVYVLEVRYRDEARSPIEFHVNSGLGRYFAPTEMHRFGGAGDGQWKTAAVPVAWDQLIRLREDADKTAVGVLSDADLPVASVQVRLAVPADQERYNAQTRAWVAGVQAEKRRQYPLRVQPRGFLKDKELSPVVPFAVPSTTIVMQDTQPKDAQVGAAIRIRMCLNELEGGCFGVYANGVELTGVDYAVSELAGPKGTLRADVIRRTAEYMVASAGAKETRLFPQRLWPAHQVDIPKGQSHFFLFNLRTRRGQAQAGKYTGTVTVTARQGQATLPLEVEVLPIDLPTMEEAGLFMGGCVRGLLPVRDFEFATEYNQNGINLWFAGVRPEAVIKDEKLQLDFAYMDDWMVAARKRGLKSVVWFLGGDPYGFPVTMHVFRELAIRDTRGGKKPPTSAEWCKEQALPANRDKPLPAARELAVEWVRQVDAHARQAGWPELVFTPFDEPAKWVEAPGEKMGYAGADAIGAGPWIRPYFEDGCAAIREGAPKARIYASINHINRSGKNEGLVFMDAIDVFSTNAIHEDAKLGDKVRAAGKDFWQYANCGAASGRPDMARFAFGFFFTAYGSRGSLCWAYNWGRGWDVSEGANWMYAWQTAFDTIPSPFFEGLREAWDDRRIIEAYRKRFAGDKEAMAVLNEVLAEATRSRTAGGRDTVYDFWAAVDDPTKLDAWRNRLLDRLARQGAEKAP